MGNNLENYWKLFAKYYLTSKNSYGIIFKSPESAKTTVKGGLKNQIGVSPSGKAKDFDSFIRKFESCYPCQQKHPTLAVGCFC